MKILYRPCIGNNLNLFSAFDPSSSQQQWAAGVWRPESRSRSSLVQWVRDTDRIIRLRYMFLAARETGAHGENGENMHTQRGPPHPRIDPSTFSPWGGDSVLELLLFLFYYYGIIFSVTSSSLNNRWTDGPNDVLKIVQSPQITFIIYSSFLIYFFFSKKMKYPFLFSLCSHPRSGLVT